MTPQQMIQDAMFLLQEAARMDGIDEDLAVSAKAAWADLHWALNRDSVKRGVRNVKPSPMPEFKHAACRGSIMLGTACGHCERCEWERQQLQERKDPTK